MQFVQSGIAIASCPSAGPCFFHAPGLNIDSLVYLRWHLPSDPHCAEHHCDTHLFSDGLDGNPSPGEAPAAFSVLTRVYALHSPAKLPTAAATDR